MCSIVCNVNNGVVVVSLDVYKIGPDSGVGELLLCFWGDLTCD